jgi:hypothetical protein
MALLAVLTLVALALPARSDAAQAACPTFSVLHDDTIGKLKLRAGTYDILIGNERKLSCAAASKLLTEFLEDYDGVLPNGWRVQARKSRFVQPSTGDAFRVSRVGKGGVDGGAGVATHPSNGRACAAPFTVEHDDTIGTLKLPAGEYRVTLLSTGRLTCTRASKKFAKFLGMSNVAAGWKLDVKTATFQKSRGYGFRVKPYV